MTEKLTELQLRDQYAMAVIAGGCLQWSAANATNFDLPVAKTFAKDVFALANQLMEERNATCDNLVVTAGDWSRASAPIIGRREIADVSATLLSQGYSHRQRSKAVEEFRRKADGSTKWFIVDPWKV